MQYIIIIYPLILGSLFLLSPKRRGVKTSLNIIKTLGTIVFAIVLLRVYWFDIYKIPSASMEQTLQVGDKIIIRKNTLPQNNDIVVFSKKMTTEITFVKRCIGVPGDTLSIVKNRVYCNGDVLHEPATLQWVYKFDTLNLDEIKKIIERETECFNSRMLLSEKEAQKIIKETKNVNIERVCMSPNANGNIYPKEKELVNNRDNVSSFIIPQKGMNIKLNKYNVLWYKRLIRSENPRITFDKNNLYLNSKILIDYTFKKDYYYMMGDNRHRSCDSRNYGFIPQNKIIGRVVLIIPNHRNNK